MTARPRTVRRRVLAVAGTLMLASATTASLPPQPVQENAPVAASGSRISLPPLHLIPTASPVASPVMKAEVTRKAASAAKPKPVIKPKSKAVKPVQASPKKPVERVTRISGYTYCGAAVSAAQRCIDQGKLTLYYPAGVKTLAGHNYMGWSWMDDLPVGRKVVIESGGLRGTYRVYGHGWAQRGSKGGKFPASGLGASVALQTCTSSGTGFSFLRRA